MRQRCFAGQNARLLTGMRMTLLVATGVVQICGAGGGRGRVHLECACTSGRGLPQFRHP